MTDRQAAEAREWEARKEAALDGFASYDGVEGDGTIDRLIAAGDALSVRLAQAEQERDKRQRQVSELVGSAEYERKRAYAAEDRLREVEQELDELLGWLRDEEDGYVRQRALRKEAEVRLRVTDALLREYEEDAELALAGIPDPMHPSLREWEQGLVCAQVLVAHIAGHDDPGNVESARAALAASGGREAPDTKEPRTS